MLGSLISAPGANTLLSKNRVWENFSTPSLTAPAELLATQTPTKEIHSSAYDSASGVCIYLYTHGNPVNNTDPSGNITLLQSSIVGFFLNFGVSVGVQTLFFNERNIGKILIKGLLAGVLGAIVGPIAAGVSVGVSAGINAGVSAIGLTVGTAAIEIATIRIAQALIVGLVAFVFNYVDHLIGVAFGDSIDYNVTVGIYSAFFAGAAVSVGSGVSSAMENYAFDILTGLIGTEAALFSDQLIPVFQGFDPDPIEPL